MPKTKKLRSVPEPLMGGLKDDCVAAIAAGEAAAKRAYPNHHPQVPTGFLVSGPRVLVTHFGEAKDVLVICDEDIDKAITALETARAARDGQQKMTPTEFADRLVDDVSTATQLDPDKDELPNVDDWRRGAESLFAFVTKR